LTIGGSHAVVSEEDVTGLRRDIERFVVRPAAERAGPSHCSQLLHISRALRAKRGKMSVVEFNQLDKALMLSCFGLRRPNYVRIA
jgi:DNA-binding GntR family transcriptional regulator